MLRTKETVAGAVAREIDRIAQTGEHAGEGAAYKAAFDRAGSNAFKHCDAFTRDAMMADLVAMTRGIVSPCVRQLLIAMTGLQTYDAIEKARRVPA